MYSGAASNGSRRKHMRVTTMVECGKREKVKGRRGYRIVPCILLSV